MRQVYLSKKTAKLRLRAVGVPVLAAAVLAVGGLKQYPFGKRGLVRFADVEMLIEAAAQDSPIYPPRHPMRPIIPRALRGLATMPASR